MHHPHEQDNMRGRRARAAVAALGALLLAAAAATPVTALEVAGVEVPESSFVDGQELRLNGAGLRSKFFVRVYVGALYLTAAGARDVDAVISRSGPKRVSMHMIHSEVSQEKTTAAWLDGFRGNTPRAELEAMMPRVERFNALWPTLKAGDTVHVDFPPAEGVRVTVNGEVRGSVEGEDLQRAVLRIWLGEDPADSDLKRGMLGGG